MIFHRKQGESKIAQIPLMLLSIPMMDVWITRCGIKGSYWWNIDRLIHAKIRLLRENEFFYQYKNVFLTRILTVNSLDDSNACLFADNDFPRDQKGYVVRKINDKKKNVYTGVRKYTAPLPILCYQRLSNNVDIQVTFSNVKHMNYFQNLYSCSLIIWISIINGARTEVGIFAQWGNKTEYLHTWFEKYW